ncbi:hypothetical protein P8452_32795 [Trifolium repens]|nr:hypothetical protein P8452_32795 [Trifolium repens]
METMQIGEIERQLGSERKRRLDSDTGEAIEIMSNGLINVDDLMLQKFKREMLWKYHMHLKSHVPAMTGIRGRQRHKTGVDFYKWINKGGEKITHC